MERGMKSKSKKKIKSKRGRGSPTLTLHHFFWSHLFAQSPHSESLEQAMYTTSTVCLLKTNSRIDYATEIFPFNLSIFKGVLNLSFQQTTPRETYSIWFSTDLIWGYLKWHFKTNWLWLVFLYCLVVNWVWGVLWPYHFLASHTI